MLALTGIVVGVLLISTAIIRFAHRRHRSTASTPQLGFVSQQWLMIHRVDDR